MADNYNKYSYNISTLLLVHNLPFFLFKNIYSFSDCSVYAVKISNLRACG